MPKNLLLALAVVLLTLITFSSHAHAQGSLSLGNVFLSDPVPCQGSHWFTYTNAGTVYTMNCFGGTVSNCANAQTLGFTYASMNPVGIAPGVTQAKGVVTFLTGSDGTTPTDGATGTISYETQFIGDYFSAGYVIVQVAWNSAWEQTDVPVQSNSPNLPNIQNAACRPATFLKWVHDNIYSGVARTNSQAGNCVQGKSAGSAATAYTLAYYGGSQWIDNVELLAGPVLSDIYQGCHEPNTNVQSVCSANGTTRSWCKLGTLDAPWSSKTVYVVPGVGGVRGWTYDNTCGVPNTTTSGGSNLAWLGQSIVDTGTQTGATPTFVYPHTAVSGWLCRTYSSGLANNSSAQGDIFYSAVGSGTPPPVFAEYSVDSCTGPEGVEEAGSYAPGAPYVQGNPIVYTSGFMAIENDTIGNPALNVPPQCAHVH
jgi:hypothetical protein